MSYYRYSGVSDLLKSVEKAKAQVWLVFTELCPKPNKVVYKLM